MRNVIDPPAVVRSVTDLRSEWEKVVCDEAAAKHAAETALVKLRDVGERLAKIKARTPHGSWLSDLKRYGFTQPSAYRRMQLDENWHLIIGHPDFEPTMGMTAALALVAQKPNHSRVNDLDAPAGEVTGPSNCPRVGNLDSAAEEGAEPANRSCLDRFEAEGTQEQAAPLTDATGRPVPEHARAAFEAAERMREWGRKLTELIREAKELAEGPGGAVIHSDTTHTYLANGRLSVLQNRPTHVCPGCAGGTDKKCECCKGQGWTTEHGYKWWQTEQERKAVKRG
jgi:hypothetical protein